MVAVCVCGYGASTAGGERAGGSADTHHIQPTNSEASGNSNKQITATLLASACRLP